MTVDLTTLGFLSSCTEAFLNKDQKLLELIPETHPFHSIENAINGKMNFDKNKRKTLVDVIKKQYENIIVKDDVKVIDNINLLLDENTFTVTTGQQLHLFLGPAFVIYKKSSVSDISPHMIVKAYKKLVTTKQPKLEMVFVDEAPISALS